MPKKQVNFKLPPDLIEALDAKALEANSNRTELVIQGIRHILGLSESQSISIDKRVYNHIDSLDARLHQIETYRVDNQRLDQLEIRVSQLETHLIEDDIHNRIHNLTQQIEELKATINQAKKPAVAPKQQEPKFSQEESPEVTAQKLTLTELAKRLSVDRSNLAKVRKNKTAIELAVYTKSRDPQGIAWRFDETEEVFSTI